LHKLYRKNAIGGADKNTIAMHICSSLKAVNDFKTLKKRSENDKARLWAVIKIFSVDCKIIKHGVAPSYYRDSDWTVAKCVFKNSSHEHI